MAIVNKLRIHGDTTKDSVVVEKILRSICAIEGANDMDKMALDELESSILVHERKLCSQDSEGEQALKASTQNQPSSFNGANQGRGRGKGRGGHARGNQHQNNMSHGRRSGRGKAADKSNIECYRCHKQNGEATIFVEKKEEVSEEISLLIACPTHQNLWYLDSGCSNHTCGDEKVFSELNTSYRDTVKLDNNSIVPVMGKGKVAIQTKENSTFTISNILLVPELKTNLLRVGQL
ncbi:PREDICTED: uncharacterized protein LOC109158500 [Ipomoea nil]|uniref:uncharacterized protein LOC109158500 n=1 Tax=Ipomoea nil TaxID=35883 RepID=UPI000901110D|nr:PREDICTED: uncharacterized protein LOC109158500 [Ipomoea nil]